MPSGGSRLPRLSIRGLDFSYGDNRIFGGLNLELGGENPVVILGPSGCGKTTLLFLIARLLKPAAGEIISGETAGGEIPGGEITGGAGALPAPPQGAPQAAMVFQEPRLLPWMTALENTALPIEGALGKKAARERARYFLELAGLGDKAQSLPAELSGGQRQRVSLARAFAFPSPVILLDEPFQSQDIPLKLQLMDLVKALLDREQGRLIIAVTHDPREALCLGCRIIILGKAGAASPASVVFDEAPVLEPEDRAYGSPAQALLERRLLGALQAGG
jgi:NitT/TauT family transport system ATP-binding protein